MARPHLSLPGDSQRLSKHASHSLQNDGFPFRAEQVGHALFRFSAWHDAPFGSIRQHIVMAQVRERLTTPEEQARWEELITTRHYLKNAPSSASNSATF